MESRTQGSSPRPRTQKISRPRPRTDPLEAKDTGVSVLQKKGLQNFFSGDSKKKQVLKFFLRKKGLQKFFFRQSPLEEDKKGLRKFSARFLAFSNKTSTVQNIVLSSSRIRGNFRGLEASRPRTRTSKCVLEAKDVLEDFTSDKHNIL